MTGVEFDSTAFNGTLDMEEVQRQLQTAGYQQHGWEVMYNGATGQRVPAKIFIGPVYYQRLKHMVADKHHVRSTGITQTLTRQPTEGRSKDGGLRYGEVQTIV